MFFLFLHMGIIDDFKRWRLAQKGLSSGRKRRTSTQSGMQIMDVLDKSFLTSLLLYGFFSLVSVGIVDFPLSSSHYSALLLPFCLGLLLCFVYALGSSSMLSNRRAFLLLGGVLIHVGLVKILYVLLVKVTWCHPIMLFLPPLGLAPMIHTVLLGRREGLWSALASSCLIALFIKTHDPLAVFFLLWAASALSVFLTSSISRRGSLLRAGFYLGGFAVLLSFLFTLLHASCLFSSWTCREEWVKVAMLLFGGMLTGMVVSGILPVLESLFGLTTHMSWLEMSDLNHKLLRKLQLEAPGTYHHSMVVATLAQSAAEKIGANASMCRVCAYFHDIGKLKKPEYFIENQGDYNPHDELTPTMSALVIIAHVKEGIDMALRHRLNPKIIDIIAEHHGTSLVQYFYHKACQQCKEQESRVVEGLENREDLPELDTKEFRYPGPIPSTIESGIISLADSVESASRSLKNPTTQKISNLVDSILFSRIESGQLADCNLTLAHISTISKSFVATLTSMMHSRIDYPKEVGKKRGVGDRIHAS